MAVVMVPELPAVIWGQHVCPYLSRRDQISLQLCSKDIYEECQRTDPKHWPSIRIRTHGLLRFAFTPDSKHLIVCGHDHDDGTFPQTKSILRVWNVATGKLRKSPLIWKLQRFMYIQGMLFSPNAQKFAVWTTQDATIRVYPVVNNQEDEESLFILPKDTFQELTPRFLDASVIEQVSFTPNSKYMVVSYSRMEVVPPNYQDHYRIAVWDLETGQCIQLSDENVFGKQFVCFDHCLLSPSHDHPTKYRVWNIPQQYNWNDNAMEISAEEHYFTLLDHPLSNNLNLRTWSMTRCPTDPNMFAALCYVPSAEEDEFVSARICVFKLISVKNHHNGTVQPQLHLLQSFSWRFIRHTPKLEWSPNGKSLIASGDDKSVDCFHVNHLHENDNSRSRFAIDTLVYRANGIDLEHEQQDVKFTLAGNQTVMAVQKGFHSLHLVSF